MPGLRSYALPLAAVVVAGALMSGCAGSSASSPSAAGDSHQSTIPSGSPSDAHTSQPPSAAATSSAVSATLDYTAPAGTNAPNVHKTVTGAAYQRLAADLAALKPVPPASAECNVLNGESATITRTTAGHTQVYVVSGSPCRGVLLTIDGAAQPKLGGSVTLLTQIRAIAGTSGLVHPLNAG